MTMVKSLLLGSAAAFVAVAGAQAADLPVKAKAAEYVKVCAAYGAGFYYIPGTDTCLKIGGYARFDAYVNGTGTFNPMISNQSSINASDTGNNYNTRVRGIVQFDARTQTEYGVLRSYVSLGANMDSWSGNNGAGGVEYDKVFIQFAGLTAGYTSSFFGANVNYMYTTPYTNSARKVNQLAYTAQFGNGISATLAMEDGRQRAVTLDNYGFNLATPRFPYAPYSAVNGDMRGGDSIPDFVGVLRIDQAWGFAQISGAAHESNIALGAGNLDASSGEWGWAVSGTAMFKLPMLAKGDGIFVTAAYADGALNYAGLSGSDSSGTLPTQIGRVNGAALTGALGAGSALYNISDVVYDGFAAYDKTTAWSITGQFRHFWTPGLRSAIMGGYISVDAPNSVYAYNNGFNDFDLWQVGFNTIWSPVKNLDIGAEVLYSKIDGSQPYGYLNTATLLPTVYGGSTDLVSGGIRIQRNF